VSYVKICNSVLARHHQEERLRRESYEIIATPTHRRRPTAQPLMNNHFDFNSLEIFSRGYSSNARGALFGTSRDQSTDTIDDLSPISPTTPPPQPPTQTARRPSLPHSGSTLEVITSVGNRSLPVSPALSGKQGRRKASGRSLFYSPMMLRKVVKQK